MIAPNREPYNPPPSDLATYYANRIAERASFDDARIAPDEWELDPLPKHEAFRRDLDGLRLAPSYRSGFSSRYASGRL